MEGHTELAFLLLERGAAVNATDNVRRAWRALNEMMFCADAAHRATLRAAADARIIGW